MNSKLVAPATIFVAALACDASTMIGTLPDQSPPPSSPHSVYDAPTQRFTIGIQLADDGNSMPGAFVFTGDYEKGETGGTSPWACDVDCFDPDSARLSMSGFRHEDAQRKDFRVCLQASDGYLSHIGQTAFGCTDWASQGGGTTGMVSDNDGFDPDSYRVQIETKERPSDLAIEIRFRIRGFEKTGDSYIPGIWSTYTGSNTRGGASGWASAPYSNDLDGLEIEMEKTETNVWHFCTPEHPCPSGYGSCETDSDCVGSATCVQDVGFTYGYSDGAVNVCVRPENI
jgi:hypothetical protein